MLACETHAAEPSTSDFFSAGEKGRAVFSLTDRRLSNEEDGDAPNLEVIMVKIDRNKIVKAAVGSARLEGYKGAVKASGEKSKEAGRPEAKTKTTAKR